MGRPQTIHVDPKSLLAAIVREWDREHARLTKAIADGEREYYSERDFGAMDRLKWDRFALRDLTDIGVKYDLELFTGKPLTSSERIRYQQAVRALEERGLVLLYGRRATHVLPTDVGRREVEANRVRAKRAATRQIDVPAEVDHA